MASIKTLSEAETARRRAVTGLRNLGRDEEANRIEGLDTREYAETKGFQLVENPYRRNRHMARKTKSRADLEAEIEALQTENEELSDTVDELQGQLDDISDIVSSEDEDEEDDEDEDKNQD